MTLYQELELAPDCTFEEIKQQYRALASKHHPDHGGDSEKFKRIKFAYEVLGDPVRRKQYDTDASTNVNVGLHQEAVVELANLFFRVIPNFNCKDGDLIASMKHEVSQAKAIAMADTDINEIQISNLEIVRDKIKIKNPNEDDIILGFVLKHLETRFQDRKIFAHRIVLADEMLLILDNYTYGYLEIVQ